MDELQLVLADRWRDSNLFEFFTCWDGDESAVWAQEVESYVRTRVLSKAQHTFKLVSGDQLVAVAAFDAGAMELPLCQPDHDEPIWDLRVVALASPFQRGGLSEALFKEVFRLMRMLDDRREFAIGLIHPDNNPSFKACGAVGLEKLYCRPDGYWVVMGPVL